VGRVAHVRFHIGMPKSMKYNSRFKHLVTPYIVPPAQEEPNAVCGPGLWEAVLEYLCRGVFMYLALSI
jgi:hypothetical protein